MSGREYRVLVTTIATTDTRQMNGHSTISQVVVPFGLKVDARDFLARVERGEVRVKTPLGVSSIVSAVALDPLPAEDAPPAAEQPCPRCGVRPQHKDYGLCVACFTSNA